MNSGEKIRVGLAALALGAASIGGTGAAWAQGGVGIQTAPGTAATAPGGNGLGAALGDNSVAADTPEPDAARESADRVLKELMTSDQNVSLEKLSQYQDFLLRLDLAVQINQKLADLEKTRAAAQPPAPPALPATGIPVASMPRMGGMPGTMTPLPTTTAPPPISTANAGNDLIKPSGQDADMPEEHDSLSSHYNLERLFGTNGAYAAYLRTDDGSRILVRKGDVLPDGVTVASIGKTSVTLKPDGHDAETIRFGPMSGDVPEDGSGGPAGRGKGS